MALDLSPRLTDRRFGFTIGTAFLAIAAGLWWQSHSDRALVAGAIGLGLAVGAVIVPRWLAPLRRGWMRGGQALSRVTNPIVLAVLYFGVLTPVGWIARALGHNELTAPPGAPSLWVRRPEDRRRSRLDRQF